MEILFGAFFVVYIMFILTLVAVPYVLKSLGLYKLAKNEGFENPWLAWIPIGGSYILGRLAKYSPYIKRKVPNIHIILPSIMGAYFVLYIVYFIYFFSIIPRFSSNMPYDLASFAPFFIFYILIILFALAIAAAYYFTLYHVYKSYDIENTVLYLILSIIFRLDFVFLFVIRNKKLIFDESKDLEE